jgi:hypothetical protein
MIDFIGDIHGYADQLEALLQKLGYRKNTDGVYAHPMRRAFFVGDYIDRGPKIAETLEIVRRMTELGSATALMGNHEYNALCFEYKDTAIGGHLRPHSIKNIVQHYETLQQFRKNPRDWDDYLEWFLGLPLFYETEQFRAVHACWDDKHIAFLRSSLNGSRLNPELLREAAREGTQIYDAVEDTLKGKEIALPEGYYFEDKDALKRTAIRIKWWENPLSGTYRSLSVEQIEHLPEHPIDPAALKSFHYYPPEDRLVFFGHYWLKSAPTPIKDNIFCLDYSVARGGMLVAYSLDEERSLDNRKITAVNFCR